MSVNSNSVIIHEPRELNPNFAIPPGLAGPGGLVYETEEDFEDDLFESSEDELDDDEDVLVEGAYGDDDGLPEDAPATPTSIVVVSQEIRLSADGSHVVDVILEVDEGQAGEYDVRVTGA